jgi:hypothetical protein
VPYTRATSNFACNSISSLSYYSILFIGLLAALAAAGF